MEWLILSFYLGLGLTCGGETIYDAPGTAQYEFPDQTVVTEFGMQALVLEHLRLGAFVRTYEVPRWPYDFIFVPFRADYGFDAAVVFLPFELAFAHGCDHIVGPSSHPKMSKGVTSLMLKIRCEQRF